MILHNVFDMDRWLGKVAVVTGASAGIGADICEKLVNEGLQVVGFARRSERIEEHAKKLQGKRGKLHAVKCDVSDYDDIVKAFKLVKDKLGPVHILVNNAGLFKISSLVDGDPRDWKTVIDTNLTGLTMCSHEAFQQMKEHGIAGHVIHINSVAGHQNIIGQPPIMNVYSPTKHAVTCLTEVMRREMYHSKLNIKITSISPGLVATEIMQAAGYQNAELSSEPILSCEDISNAVLYTLGTPQHVHICELTIRPTGEGVYS